ncbi:acetyl-CoA carboxylase biotin carboxylase subunit [bacterium]|nr:acetyl-CoA carboxylase biotin carboxylase subunit [bacterium]
MFKKILIANRGEIALRIIRACHEMGIKTVAVYSEADEFSLHVKFADEAVCIGPAESAKSYLDVKRIISAAEITDSEAIHPGYGFLAENAEFVDIIEEHNIKFIGPSADVIRSMGEKATAKQTMKANGVPVIPGSDGAVSDFKELKKLANEIGYPVIIKASFGGGGRGMRLVNEESELQRAYDTARSESAIAFGNDEMYLEKFIVNPRHIEVQVLADSHGNVVALGERECSIQRRHQKLIEEAPSPAVTPEMREFICGVSAKATKAVGYENAGTIEYILDKEGNFYFMEMNTRVQVEHPVTEMVYNLDIINHQIRIAAGEAIDINRFSLQPRGHSIECRINAENPFKNFMPSPTTIENLHLPGGYEVRMDSHIYAGYTIPHQYDTMIAKFITHGADRKEAIDRMRRVLDEAVIEGVATTIPAHKQILATEKFQSGNFDTSFLDNFQFNLEEENE